MQAWVGLLLLALGFSYGSVGFLRGEALHVPCEMIACFRRTAGFASFMLVIANLASLAGCGSCFFPFLKIVLDNVWMRFSSEVSAH